MRIAITGGTGNLGTAVLRRLGGGDHEIVGIARRRPPGVPPYADAAWHTVDLARPDAAERLRLPFTGTDVVIHLAWGFQPSHRPTYLRATGVDGTRAVVRAAAECGVPHLVHVSSSAVYSPGSYGRPVEESWPRRGIAASAYSQDKVAAEQFLDAHVRTGSPPSVTVLRPGLIGQYAAGNQLLRYVFPDWLPHRALRVVRLVAIDERLCIPAVRSDDVADAIARALEQRRSRAYNIASDVPARGRDIVVGLHAVGVHVPATALRAAAQTTWRMHLQPVDGGWIDLAYATPLVDCSRIRADLGWTPHHDGPDVVRELVRGMRDRAGTASPVLEEQSVVERLTAALRRGSVGVRTPT